MTEVHRRALLTAHLAATAAIDRVEIREVRMPAGQAAGRHLHPCPVVGLVLAGSILFQIEGEEPRVLHPGDAFFEPKDVPILHFDARDAPTTFVAFYLLGADEDELIRML